MAINKIFLDSGAFSVFSQGIEIDIQEYISFIKKHKHKIEVYANLDVIGDMKATMVNQKIMEDAGLNPLPVFQKGKSLVLLKELIDRYDYVALGGLVSEGVSAFTKIRKHLDNCWRTICDTPDGLPKAKIHGFGITSVNFLTRYPWYSVDSTSWKVSAGYGFLLLPALTKPYNYLKGSQIRISVETKDKRDMKHFSNLPKSYKKKILKYLKSINIRYGDSKKKCGVSTHYLVRRKANIIFSYHLSEALTKLPITEKMGFKKSIEPLL